MPHFLERALVPWVTGGFQTEQWTEPPWGEGSGRGQGLRVLKKINIQKVKMLRSNEGTADQKLYRHGHFSAREASCVGTRRVALERARQEGHFRQEVTSVIFPSGSEPSSRLLPS